MRKYDQIGLCTPDVYLPKPELNMLQWAVIACDQFTSQPEYWQQVDKIVGDSPSTFHLTLPEAYLGKSEEAQRLNSIHQNMERYINEEVVVSHEGMIYVERQVCGKLRKGLVVCLDLEQYDFNKGSASLIRATEGTILDRLPPRIRIRENALLELPHILVLIDDPDKTVIEPLAEQKPKLTPVYHTDLMLGSGHIDGWRIEDLTIETRVVEQLTRLLDPEKFQVKYQVDAEKPILLYAVGDGNHSLATAKAIWEKLKPQVGMDHPARYALVELENVHDSGLEFEPIHRVVFKTTCNFIELLQTFFNEKISLQPVNSMQGLNEFVSKSSQDHQHFGVISEAGLFAASLSNPDLALPVGNVQRFLDDALQQKLADCIDYVHGEDVLYQLGIKPGNIGFYLPSMKKTDLFRTVILDGALPRKTFSMGEAIEKRFYIEARKIK